MMTPAELHSLICWSRLLDDTGLCRAMQRCPATVAQLRRIAALVIGLDLDAVARRCPPEARRSRRTAQLWHLGYLLSLDSFCVARLPLCGRF